MIASWLGALVVSLLAIAGLALPWWWSGFTRRVSLQRRAANVAAYRSRLQELETDVAAAILPADAVESTKEELAAHLLADAGAAAAVTPAGASSKRPVIVAALALLAFAGGWYASSESWHTQALIDLSKTDPTSARVQALDRMIDKLRRQVDAHPDDVESWAWLARSYGERGSNADAAKAYARASELKGGQDPDLLVSQGEALALAQNRSMAGEPAQLFAQALKLAPEHMGALWYSGIAALQAHDDMAAIGYWERLSKLPLGDDASSTVNHALAQLRERNGIKAPAPSAQAAAPPGGLKLQVHVSIAPALAAKVRPQDTLFVYAQDPSGPPMPLAVQKFPAGQFPAETTLDDTMGPMPTVKLSSVDHWRIVARLSKNGSAIPQTGDLEGSVEVNKSDAGKPVRIVIDRTHPG